MSTSTPPRPATLRARPLLFLTTFALVHQAVASGALAPAYAFFAGGDTSTALLAGPVAARVLRTDVPWTGRTVADVLEDGVRSGVRSGFGMLMSWRQRRAEVAEVAEDHPPPGTLQRMVARARGIQSTAQQPSDAAIAASAVDGLEGRQDWKGRLSDTAARVRLKHVMDAAAAYLVVKVHMLVSCAVTSTLIAAQALFPLRLGLSLFLAPRLARAFARRWP
jgi:hypothetical protein